ncbi:cytochrome c oxidase assembly factor Coa1 family protein [Myxococcus qinghaiensis]|uniref:cytochrome c oxidase assembly factor Coa1 family protein n=1 Tax=Myxococcus qinghaiensis TaxID=2906758 RepID=UPI0020A7D520|nr:cytochrome c oxidase assembly factor Coa1 family protein [Myxococcus qinghaiensis]MCP3163391.1 cytochrome c oxidase assembly factor 1 family protein [Myxococcus qinghaiensis]
MRPHRLDSPWQSWMMAAALVLGGLGCFASGVAWVSRSLFQDMEQELRRNDVHRLALRTAEASPLATERLGTPLTSSFLTLRAHGSNLHEGLVDFDLTVQGPLGRGVLETQVTYTKDLWTLRRLVLRPEGGDSVELLTGGSTPALPAD